MYDDMGPLRVTHAWSPAQGQYIYQIAWTTEQLQQIEEAIETGDQSFLATVEEAIRQALNVALTPKGGKRPLA
jgi:hypothetical protein